MIFVLVLLLLWSIVGTIVAFAFARVAGPC